MKTILTSDGIYKRVTDEVAQDEVQFRKAKFVSKSEWKKNERDYSKSEDTEKVKPKKSRK